MVDREKKRTEVGDIPERFDWDNIYDEFSSKYNLSGLNELYIEEPGRIYKVYLYQNEIGVAQIL